MRILAAQEYLVICNMRMNMHFIEQLSGKHEFMVMIYEWNDH
jgi:hypothetical protein